MRILTTPCRGILKVAIPLIALLIPVLATSQARASDDIYPVPEAAQAEIKTALTDAARLHKRVILDFGGNWCGDCRALYKYFHQEPNASLLKENFILVDVNIGKFDKNLDIAKTYGVPMDKGVPALAVLGSNGRLLFSQKQGEFESMRRMDPSAVTDFLKHWKG